MNPALQIFLLLIFTKLAVGLAAQDRPPLILNDSTGYDVPSFYQTNYDTLTGVFDIIKNKKLRNTQTHVQADRSRVHSNITSNGYRFDDGQIYTMRIKVPNGSGVFLQSQSASGDKINPDYQWTREPKPKKE